MNTITNQEEFCGYNHIITHGGIFHADDVFACAYINVLRSKLGMNTIIPERKNIITEEDKNDPSTIIVDIGDGEFDHHHCLDDSKIRSNGGYYSSFGLVVRKYHSENECEYYIFDKMLCESIDSHDNEGTVCSLSSAISAFNVPWNGNRDETIVRFCAAMGVAQKIIENALASAESTALATEKTKLSNKNKKFDTLWEDDFFPVNAHYTDAHFLGSISLRGGYQVLSIKDKGENRELLPYVTEDQMNEYNIMFIHRGRFIASFKTKEDAMRFMENRREL